ncbi:putative bifunctional diguanylate cyclase/phosphodiesterase [Altererythrobacter sp. Root672]|uniref:putative bifunctional diguanylate cyclase/phosphodiesterase n=1 Tax=Altererythrobacter sp. Root672 TaxID=1736584 RepID=UPI0006F3A9C3|nr:EAL domain-containing protein [Altererythrobacter sp. Root672]KRA83662.1 diguanylate cyclase [Altererythrobacter sp. Root672]
MKHAVGKFRSSLPGTAKAERDIVTLGVAVAAIILFVGTGGTIMHKIVRSFLGFGPQPDSALSATVLLNIALLIFGWRRYSDLHEEVAERRRAEERANQLAAMDPLTGSLNRRSGGPAIDKLLADSRASRREVALLMVDLDKFKQINDLNGHKMGDAVLVEIARRIGELLPSDGILARIGGDEFVCALPYDSRDSGDIDRLALQLIASVSAPINAYEMQLEAAVSIGMASSGEHFDAVEPDAEGLIHHADMAMYHAKKHGRNRYFWFEPAMERELRHRNDLETGIRRGIPAGEFVPFYEQQIDLETGELVGFEMLARWQSPLFGLVNPDTFIPIAEEIDQIGALSESLIRQALDDAKEWHQKLTLSVNVSPMQMRDPWFAQKLLRLLIESGFPPSRLEVEITESCLHENLGAVRAMVTSLKNQGIRISLDDFGTGYSSLSQLRALPFDRLKIDRSFVSELANEGMGHELVEAIVSLGRDLSLPMTAEGVESHEILEKLRSFGQLKGQGYLYGLPEDAVTTRARLARLDLLVNGKPAIEPLPAGETADEDTTADRKAG